MSAEELLGLEWSFPLCLHVLGTTIPYLAPILAFPCTQLHVVMTRYEGPMKLPRMPSSF